MKLKNWTLVEELTYDVKIPHSHQYHFLKKFKLFMDFLLHGDLKLLGDIKHYTVKHEWRGRGSQHVHVLLWSNEDITNLSLKITI